jgi:hypothetical protein
MVMTRLAPKLPTSALASGECEVRKSNIACRAVVYLYCIINNKLWKKNNSESGIANMQLKTRKKPKGDRRDAKGVIKSKE